MVKACARCGVGKTLDEFHRHRLTKDGRSNICKPCACEKTRLWAAANPERVLQLSRDGYARNRERSKAAALAWARAHPERRRAASRASDLRHREKNRRKRLDQQAARYRADLEKARAKGRENAKRFRRRRPDLVAAILKRARAARLAKDPDGYRLRRRSESSRRRAMKAATNSGPVDYKRIAERDRMVCHICKKKVRKRDLHFDHVIPIARGGAHTDSNIAVSHARCNLAKHDKPLTLF